MRLAAHGHGLGVISITLANMLVRCNGRKKNYQAFMQNDDVHGTYLLMFYPFIIYFMMTVASIIYVNANNK